VEVALGNQDQKELLKRAFDARTAEVDEFRPSRPGNKQTGRKGPAGRKK
jgi:hypothetical protein